MINRLTLLVILACVPRMANASEGLIYAGVYECRAISMTKNMVNACISQHPEISAESSVALSKWLERNAAKAESTAQACMTELHQLAKTELEAQQMIEKMNQIEQEMIEDFKDRMKSKGVIVCNEAIRQIETGVGGDLK